MLGWLFQRRFVVFNLTLQSLTFRIISRNILYAAGTLCWNHLEVSYFPIVRVVKICCPLFLQPSVLSENIQSPSSGICSTASPQMFTIYDLKLSPRWRCRRCYLGCDTMWTHRQTSAFWRWRQHVFFRNTGICLPTSHHGVATRRTTSSDKEWSEKLERSRAEQGLLHMSEDERRNKKQTDTMPENEFNMAYALCYKRLLTNALLDGGTFNRKISKWTDSQIYDFLCHSEQYVTLIALFDRSF